MDPTKQTNPCSTYSFACQAVEVEVNSAWGDTVIVIVGLPDAAVKESRDRVSTALHNSGFKVPMGRTTINLAPADVKKEGPSFDLPIALGASDVTLIDMVCAYSAFATGTHVDPVFYLWVTNKDGTPVSEIREERTDLISQEVIHGRKVILISLYQRSSD
jgi:membrane peptidoglycan carboxypeptidase